MSEEQVVQQTVQKPVDEAAVLLEKLRGSLGFIERSKATAEEIVSALNIARGTADADILAISSAKQNFEDIRVQGQEKIKDLKKVQDSLQERIDNVSHDIENLEKLVQQSNDIKMTYEGLRKNIDEDVSHVMDAKNYISAAEEEVHEKQDRILQEQEALVQTINQINEGYSKVLSLANELLVDKFKQTQVSDEAGNLQTVSTLERKSLKNQIDDFFKEVKAEYSDVQTVCDASRNELHSFKEEAIDDLQSLKASTVKEFADLKYQLEARILSLLPNATAASLAHGYVDSKNKYDNNKITICYYLLFLMPLIMVTVYFIDLQGKSFDEVSLLLRFLVVSPMLAISSFGLWSIRLNRKLFEEYNHKQRVMQLYDGFTKVFDDDADDQKKELVTIMLDTVKGKPSLAMSKYDRGGDAISAIVALKGKKDSD